MAIRRWWRRGASLALAGLLGAALGANVARRWPFESIERRLERFSIALRPIDPWAFAPRSPHPRYEALSAVVGGRLYVLGGFDTPSLELTPRVDVYDPAAGSWSRLGDMPVAVSHANAALAGGELWIVGGFVGQHPGPATDATWRFDPEQDTWRPGPALPEPRGGGALVAAPDGALHYFGGWPEDRHSDSPDHWRLAPGDSTWVPRAPMPAPRGHMGAVQLGGYLYAIGGCFDHDVNTEDTDLVHRYDPASDTWQEMAALPGPRSHIETSTTLFNGQVMVAGGRSRETGQGSLPEVLIYDPATDTWAFFAMMPRGLLAPVMAVLDDALFLTVGGEGGSVPRNVTSWVIAPLGPWRAAPQMPSPLGEVSGGVIDGRLYVTGQGNRETLVLDFATGEWAPIRAARQRPKFGHHAAAEVLGGELYLLGGLTGVGASDHVQIYRPETDRWRLGTPLPFAVGSSASAVIGGRLYLAGGIVGDSTTGNGAVFDPATGLWTPIAPMPRPRNHTASATDGERLFVFGGRGPGSGNRNVVANGFDDVQIYDPATDSWIASGDGAGAPKVLPQARGGMGKAVYLNGEFYVIGGETQDGPGATPERVYDRVDIYNPATNSWRAGPPLPTARHGIFPVVWGSSIWVAGGGIRAAGSSSTVVEVLTP